MKVLTGKKNQDVKKNGTQLGQYATAAEASKAKNSDFMKSLKGVDLSFLNNK